MNINEYREEIEKQSMIKYTKISVIFNLSLGPSTTRA